VETAAAGDAAARRVVEELFVACRPRIGRYLVQMVRDRELAADLLQDTFHDALAARGDLAQVRNREAWLFGIARHRALRALRRRRRLGSALLRLGAHQPAVHEDEDAVAVLDLLERTPSAEDRALVLLRHLRGFEAVELAAMTRFTPEAVR
jgi:RNA polymerase sigma factor (sigma-70 family)